MTLSDMLRNVRGEFEPIRVVGVVGAFAFIIGANAFAAWHFHRSGEFDLVAYCTAFPGGLSVLIGAIAAALRVKDKSTEEARAVSVEHP